MQKRDGQSQKALWVVSFEGCEICASVNKVLDLNTHGIQSHDTSGLYY